MFYFNNFYTRMKQFEETSSGSAKYIPPRSRVIKNKKRKGKKKK